MAEKCTRQLPAVRVSESVETSLMRLAARDERTLSEYIRLTLERHVFGHARTLQDDGQHVTDFGALHCSADELGGRSL
jgi:hypothetical protein